MVRVIDDLLSTSTTNALSANQGRILNEKILAIVSITNVEIDNLFEEG